MGEPVKEVLRSSSTGHPGQRGRAGRDHPWPPTSDHARHVTQRCRRADTAFTVGDAPLGGDDGPYTTSAIDHRGALGPYPAGREVHHTGAASSDRKYVRDRGFFELVVRD